MQTQGNKPVVVSKQALQRMPYYLEYLKKLRTRGVEFVSAPMIAQDLKLNEVQVRKDLAAVSSVGGRPKTGFSVPELLQNMESFLGYNDVNEAALVGVGALGRALLSYNGFSNYGLKIIAAFDADPSLYNTELRGTAIFPAERLTELCARLKIRIGIVTVPAGQAQAVCNMLVAGGVLAIWNFAPAHLNVPPNILVQNENMAASLAMLSKHLRQKLETETD